MLKNFPRPLEHPGVPELLAPAGSMECLHAAVRAGADAVYLGLDKFNARRNASNFTPENLSDACAYAHLRGRRVYVTMNVEILPTELDEALRYAQAAADAGCDALILQDVGLVCEVRRQLPDLPVHLSTQMNIHNAAGIELAAALGASRVTLARELTLAEVAHLTTIAADFDIEVECFGHGALCVCYSGQCLMSSLIGGRSANRGLCAQACRLPYELHCEDGEGALPAEGEHLLSPRDLCTIDLLADLSAANVASLKVEGRMKSPEYVFEVVSTYREALDELGAGVGADAGADEGADAIARSEEVRAARRERLAEAFSRGFTTAYLTNERGNDIMSYGRPNNRGVAIGRVASCAEDSASFRTEVDVHAGDVVEFWTNRGHFTAELGNDASAGSMASVPVDQRTSKGDRVFRVRNAATAFQDDAFAPRIPISGRIELLIGKPAKISFSTGEVTCTVEGEVVEPARTKALDAADVAAHVDRLGQTPFMLAEPLDVSLDSNAGMSFSHLHALRAECLQQLQREILSAYEQQREHEHDQHLSRDELSNALMAQLPSAETVPSEQATVCAWATNPACARAARKAGAARIYVPLLNYRRKEAQMVGVRMGEVEQAGYPKGCVAALPTIDHDPVDSTREAQLAYELWDYVAPSKPVLADNLADAWRARLQGAAIEVGPHVPVTNQASLRFMAELGVSRVWLSPELTLGQVADLAEASTIELGITVSGAQELMITEHCLLMSQGACNEECSSCKRRFKRHWLVDRKGFEFPVITDALGRSHLYNGIALDASGSMMDLMDCGVRSFMVDTTLLNKEQAGNAVRRIVRARDLALSQHRALEKQPGTTTGHLFRGVQ